MFTHRLKRQLFHPIEVHLLYNHVHRTWVSATINDLLHACSYIINYNLKCMTDFLKILHTYYNIEEQLIQHYRVLMIKTPEVFDITGFILEWEDWDRY